MGCDGCIDSQCASQKEACYSSGNATEDQQCRDAVQCAIAVGCVMDPTDPMHTCYCGTALSACLAKGGMCVAEVEAAAATVVQPTVFLRIADQSFPIGRAQTLAICIRDKCAAECG